MTWISLRTVHHVLTEPPYFVDRRDAVEVRQSLRDSGFNVFDADVVLSTDERGVLRALGDALGFPDYYAPNWDAFDDCVGDMLREGAGRVAVVVSGLDTLLWHDLRAFVRTLHLLLDVVTDVERTAGALQLEFVFVGDFGRGR